MKIRLLSLLATLVAFSTAARADFLDGRVVDANGNGIAGVDIDARNASGGGGDVNLLNDGTDALGFFHVTIPAGNYRIMFSPPAPPGSTSLYTEVTPVAVSGTANMGTVVMTPGIAVTGTLVNTSFVGIAGVNIDALDAGGNNADLVYDSTGVGGSIAVNVPIGSTQIRFDPSAILAPVYAPLAIDVVGSGNIALGTVTLEQGYVVSAIARGPGSVAINNCNVNVIDPVTGRELYTPGDSSNATGFVDLVVPAGTWWFDFVAPAAQHLAVERVTATIGANTSLGIVNLSAGISLSGTVRDCTNAVVAGANIDLEDSVTRTPIALSNDGTNGAGFYQVWIKPGTYDVHFKAPGASALGFTIAPNVVVAAATVQDGVLGPVMPSYCFGDGSGTACPCGNTSSLGSKAGCLNALGTAGKLVASGPACVSADGMRLSGTGMGNSPTLYFQGTTQLGATLGVAFGDGLRCVGGSVIRLGVKTNVNGASSFPSGASASISVTGLVLAGQARNYQTWYRDSAAFCSASTFNLTNGVTVTWAP